MRPFGRASTSSFRSDGLGHPRMKVVSVLVVLSTGLATWFLPANGAAGLGQSGPGAPVPSLPARISMAVKSSPSDTNSSSNPVLPGEAPSLPALPVGYVLNDIVVSNTDPNLKTTDAQTDSEPSLAINGANTNEIDITGFSPLRPEGASVPSDAV